MNGTETPTPARRHLLTVAVEDYFHATALNPLVPDAHWRRFESRVAANTRRALELLASHDQRATFFVLGWVAEQSPEIVREIVDRGHEVASKGYRRRAPGQMTREEFREDVQRAREALEHATGQRVFGHRVAQGSLGLDDLWALDILAEEGFRYDSSIYPRLRSIAREPWRRFPHVHHGKDREIHEFPLSTWGTDSFLLPAAGGNYFRQLPPALMRRAVSHWDRVIPHPFNMYFHVWELDSDLPRLANAGPLTRIRQYRNLRKMPKLLADYFTRYAFTGISDWMDWKPEPVAASPRRDRAVSVSRPVPSEPAPASGTRRPVTVVVPCFNEELVLPYLANTLDEVREQLCERYDLRFLFVDDASQDDTWDSLERLFGGRSDCRRIRHDRNRGVAGAICTGLEHAETEIACSIDCDCTYDPAQLAEMIPLMKEGVAMVTASPYHPLGAVEGVPGWRLFLSRTLSRMYRLVLHHKLDTYTSCFRVYRREAVVGMPLANGGFLGVAEMLGRLDLAGERIVECPAVLQVRVLGHSKMKTLATIRGHLGLWLRLARARWLAPSSAKAAVRT
ncbi:MAG: glycosyltransferase [Proteobacteria bacterium]|nr:glycosyltransferase [Pseudomonadota bacterium]